MTADKRGVMDLYRRRAGGPAGMLHWTRVYLPFGKWTCADGREVLFNRDYVAMWQRSPGQPATAADPDEHVRFVKQSRYYDEGSDPRALPKTVKLCEQVLRNWGLPVPSHGVPDRLAAVIKAAGHQIRRPVRHGE